jgi:hypothetical protein
MKQRTLTKILAFVLIGTFVAGISAFADDIKARMKKRLPVIKELKAQGIVGEDNKVSTIRRRQTSKSRCRGS